MKISTISEAISFARHRMPYIPDVLWRGHTIAILSAVAGICLLYLFRERLLECLWGAQQKSPEVPSYKSFEDELISFQQFIEIHERQLLAWLQTEESSPEWQVRLEFCQKLMSDLMKQLKRIHQEEGKDTEWDACRAELRGLAFVAEGKEVCDKLRKCLVTLARLNEQRMEPLAQELPICCPRSFASYQEYLHYLCQDTGYTSPSKPSAEARRQVKKEAFVKLSTIEINPHIIPQIYVKFFDHIFRKLRMYVCWDLVEQVERDKEIYTELDLRYQIITPFLAIIEQGAPNCNEVVAEKLARMKLGLLKLLDAPKFSIDFITQLEQFDTAQQISEIEKYAGLNLRSQIVEPLVAEIDQLAQGSEVVVAGELGRMKKQFLSFLDDPQFFIDIIRRLEELVQERQSLQLEIYAKLDLLYSIVKPLVAEIEELAQSSEAPVAKKLGQMKMRLFTLLADPEYSKDIIQELEELDKERQSLQLESYTERQGLLPDKREEQKTGVV